MGGGSSKGSEEAEDQVKERRRVVTRGGRLAMKPQPKKSVGPGCLVTVYAEQWYPRPCGNPAKFEKNGIHYCGIHNPDRKRPQKTSETGKP